jgi:hypothetical protein
MHQFVETIEAPQNRRFYGKMECLTVWPTYIGDKRRILVRQNMGNTLGEHIGNLRNNRELEG